MSRIISKANSKETHALFCPIIKGVKAENAEKERLDANKNKRHINRACTSHSIPWTQTTEQNPCPGSLLTRCAGIHRLCQPGNLPGPGSGGESWALFFLAHKLWGV